MCVAQWFCPLLVYVTCDILVDSHCLGCKNNPWIPLWYSQICPRSNNSVLKVMCSVNPSEWRHCRAVYMCISWYDMTLSCSVPPTSTWCHSGGSYELTAPVYNFLLTGGQYTCLLCYTWINAHAWFFNPNPSYFSSCLDTRLPCLYKVSESTLHKPLLWVAIAQQLYM